MDKFPSFNENWITVILAEQKARDIAAGKVTPPTFNETWIEAILSEKLARDIAAGKTEPATMQENLDELQVALQDGVDPTIEDNPATIEDNLETLQEQLELFEEATPKMDHQPPPPADPTAGEFLALAGGAYNHAHNAKGGGNVKAWLEAAVGFAKVAGALVEANSWRAEVEAQKVRMADARKDSGL